VDAKHHLIVTHEVTNKGSDRAQLSSMGEKAQEALGMKTVTALADRGYYAGPEILACEQAGINALVPKSHTSNNRKRPLIPPAGRLATSRASPGCFASRE
jgi:hypothetical protein